MALEMLCQFPDRGGLAGTVDAGHHDDERGMTADFQRFYEGCQQLGQQPDQFFPNFGRLCQTVLFDFLPEFIQKIFSGGQTDIGDE